MLILVVALAPVIALVFYFYHQDKYEKEPRDMLIKAFVYGALVANASIVLELLVGSFFRLFISSPVVLFYIKVFLEVGLIEEACKFFIFMRLIYNHKEFNEPYDAILYAVMISLGFAAVENILYVTGASIKFDALAAIHVGVARAIFAVPGHAVFGVIMGYCFGMAKLAANPKRRFDLLVNALILPAVLHGFYDFFALGQPYTGIFYLVVLMILCWAFAFRAIKIQLARSPFKDKDNDTEDH